MLILGVDPGTIFTGYGIVEYSSGSFECILKNHLNLSDYTSLPHKLAAIYKIVDETIKLYKPDEFSIETAFFGKNVQSAMKISYARSAAMLAAFHNGIEISEYSPREIKRSVTGKGAATKEQVQFMVRTLLNLRDDKIKLDETDALACAMCHAFRCTSVNTGKATTWKKYIQQNPEKVIGD